ncbi:MAG: chalcone isomerase family protein [Planctomycetes bacterium]|nr:chalcone isomerase family protein [Planctomycetota bacterium]
MKAMMIALLLSMNAHAGSLAGVTMPDTAQLGGQTLVLNGMGLREKYMLDIYVGGLYLPQKSSDAAAIINMDAPKRVTMTFIYDEVPKDKVVETLYEGIAKYPEFASLKPQLDKFAGLMEDLVKGDQMVYEYVPGQGTSVIIKGKNKGTVPGTDFMKLVFSIYIGSKPANEALKAGMLGKG